MKRFLAVFLFAMFFSTGAVWAAGSWSGTIDTGDGGEIRRVQSTFTADSSDGSVPVWTVNLGRKYEWYLIRAVTDPGTTAPTDDYDIVLNDTWSVDYANSQLLNRDEATTEKVAFGKYEPIYSPISVTLTNNSVHSATGTVVLVFGR